MNTKDSKTYGSGTGDIENGHSINGSKKDGDDRSGSPFSDGSASSASSAKEFPSAPSTQRGEEEEQPLSGRRRRLAFLVEMVLIFALYLPFALLAPFYPPKAKDKGLSPFQVGLLLALFAGVASLFSILIGQFLSHIGPKFAFVAGAFLVGGSSILMAPQVQLTSEVEFFWFTLATLFVWAIGHAAANTSCTAMISYNFPGNEAILFGIMESFIGLGFLLGGPIGSGFYRVGGYSLPFYVFGGFLVLLVVLNFFTVPSYNARPREKTSVLELLRIPSVWTTCLALTITFGILGIITVGLAVHLTDTFEVKDAYAGFFWVLSGVFKTVSSTLIGTLTNKLVETNSAAARLILIVGQILGCITLLFIGPSQTLHLPDKLALVCIGLALEGIVKSCVIVPSLVDVTVTARWSGLPDNFATQSIIAGLFWGAFSFGTFLGPLIGGALIHQFGFSGACNVGAVVFLIMGAILSIYLAWEYRCGRGRREAYRLFAISGSDELNDEVPLVATK
ncbi:MFS-type transporter SLC18B1-like [Amphiura filiformis]|uniref:MFS-type transporter SLC18B1-like n=1 Tax=Amphiura filiformis TaxID=82378 RepID=UPI003B218BDC